MPTLLERLERRLDKTGDCWIWTGATAGSSGRYGYIMVSTPPRKMGYTHRVAYELFVGEIPDGMTVDHLCRERLCCNPAHLEVVTKRENTLRGVSPPARQARQTHCHRGHPLPSPSADGHRRCRRCDRERVVA